MSVNGALAKCKGHRSSLVAPMSGVVPKVMKEGKPPSQTLDGIHVHDDMSQTLENRPVVLSEVVKELNDKPFEPVEARNIVICSCVNQLG